MNTSKRFHSCRHAGFTMLELAVVLVILGLVIVVTLASIMDHQSASQRKQVVHRMNEVAEWLHLQQAQTKSYVGILPPNWTTEDGGQRYDIALLTQPMKATDPADVFPALGAGAFTLKAVPRGDDPSGCGALLMDHTGRKGITGTDATVAECWGS